MGMLGEGEAGGYDVLIAKYLVLLFQVRCWMEKTCVVYSSRCIYQGWQ
jgi:hypothetical protein